MPLWAQHAWKMAFRVTQEPIRKSCWGNRLQLGRPQKHRRFLSDSHGGEPCTEAIAEACDFPLTGGGGM